MPRLRDAARASALAPSIFRRRQAQILPEWSGVIAAGEVAECRDGGDSHGPLDATAGLECVNHWAEPPGGDRLVECLGTTLEPGGVLGERSDRCLEADVLCWGGTDDRAEPAQVSRAPGGPSGRADIMPPPKRFQATWGGLEIGERIFTRVAQVTKGVVLDGWDIDRREMPRAHQPGPLDGIPTVGVPAVAGLLGHECGRDDPAARAVVRQLAIEPVATGARFIAAD
jgi:hypothetical protein